MRIFVVCVGDVPCPLWRITTSSSSYRLKLCLLGVEGIAVAIRGRSERGVASRCIDLEHRIVMAINGRVQAKAEQMLMIVGIDARVYFGAIWRG